MISGEQKFNLITQRQSFLRASDADSFKALLAKKEKPKIVWGTYTSVSSLVGFNLTIKQKLHLQENVSAILA